ncbi:hypothetical protein Q5752_001903 [Cryptotrichosporon argae]
MPHSLPALTFTSSLVPTSPLPRPPYCLTPYPSTYPHSRLPSPLSSPVVSPDDIKVDDYFSAPVADKRPVSLTGLARTESSVHLLDHERADSPGPPVSLANGVDVSPGLFLSPRPPTPVRPINPALSRKIPGTLAMSRMRSPTAAGVSVSLSPVKRAYPLSSEKRALSLPLTSRAHRLHPLHLRPPGADTGAANPSSFRPAERTPIPSLVLTNPYADEVLFSSASVPAPRTPMSASIRRRSPRVASPRAAHTPYWANTAYAPQTAAQIEPREPGGPLDDAELEGGGRPVDIEFSSMSLQGVARV